MDYTLKVEEHEEDHLTFTLGRDSTNHTRVRLVVERTYGFPVCRFRLKFQEEHENRAQDVKHFLTSVLSKLVHGESAEIEGKELRLRQKPLLAYADFSSVYKYVREIAILASLNDQSEGEKLQFVPFRATAVNRMIRVNEDTDAYLCSLRSVKTLLLRAANDSAVSRLLLLAKSLYRSRRIDETGNFGQDELAVDPTFASLAYMIALSQRFSGCVDERRLQQLRETECPKVSATILEASEIASEAMDYPFQAVFCGDTVQRALQLRALPVRFRAQETLNDEENEDSGGEEHAFDEFNNHHVDEDGSTPAEDDAMGDQHGNTTREDDAKDDQHDSTGEEDDAMDDKHNSTGEENDAAVVNNSSAFPIEQELLDSDDSDEEANLAVKNVAIVSSSTDIAVPAGKRRLRKKRRVLERANITPTTPDSAYQNAVNLTNDPDSDSSVNWGTDKDDTSVVAAEQMFAQTPKLYSSLKSKVIPSCEDGYIAPTGLMKDKPLIEFPSQEELMEEVSDLTKRRIQLIHELLRNNKTEEVKNAEIKKLFTIVGKTHEQFKTLTKARMPWNVIGHAGAQFTPESLKRLVHSPTKFTNDDTVLQFCILVAAHSGYRATIYRSDNPVLKRGHIDDSWLLFYRRQNLASFDVVVVPYNITNSHWFTILIWVGRRQESDGTVEVEVIDSLYNENRDKVDPLLNNFKTVWNMLCTNRKIGRFEIKNTSQNTPRQDVTKNYACGIYTCMNVMARLLHLNLNSESYQCDDMNMRKWVLACLLDMRLMLPQRILNKVSDWHNENIKLTVRAIQEKRQSSTANDDHEGSAITLKERQDRRNETTQRDWENVLKHFPEQDLSRNGQIFVSSPFHSINDTSTPWASISLLLQTFKHELNTGDRYFYQTEQVPGKEGFMHRVCAAARAVADVPDKNEDKSVDLGLCTITNLVQYPDSSFTKVDFLKALARFGTPNAVPKRAGNLFVTVSDPRLDDVYKQAKICRPVMLGSEDAAVPRKTDFLVAHPNWASPVPEPMQWIEVHLSHGYSPAGNSEGDWQLCQFQRVIGSNPNRVQLFVTRVDAKQSTTNTAFEWCFLNNINLKWRPTAQRTDSTRVSLSVQDRRHHFRTRNNCTEANDCCDQPTYRSICTADKCTAQTDIAPLCYGKGSKHHLETEFNVKILRAGQNSKRRDGLRSKLTFVPAMHGKHGSVETKTQAKILGRGVYTTSVIRAETPWVLPYVGELITSNELYARYPGDAPSNYTVASFTTSPNAATERQNAEFHIDGCFYRNVGNLVNHSASSPNLEMVGQWADAQHFENMKESFKASITPQWLCLKQDAAGNFKSVNKNTELLFNYGWK